MIEILTSGVALGVHVPGLLLADRLKEQGRTNPQRTPFFEYVPQQWPAGFTFGTVKAEVASAAGPKDTGLADALAIHVRTRADGVLAGHFSADGGDWTEPLVRQVQAGFRRYLLREEGT